jgi:GNAT superfamily N-acetyltransferase
MTTPPPAPGHRVERAAASDAGALAQVIADAFFDLAVSRWLISDPGDRRAVFPGYFRIYVDHALAAGLVLTTPARDAAALWIPIGPNGPGEPEGYRARLAAVTGRHLARFEALDEQLARHHPVGTAHEHLAILAVRPGRQRLGTGTALLNARHAVLNQHGTPAYLEASDPAKRDIYRGHGYTDHGEPVQLPDGPQMLPMWRHPRHSGAPGT